MNTKSLMQALLDAGYPANEIFSHRSDLYVFVTPLTTRVIREWLKEQGSTVCPYKTFRDQVTGKSMWDLSFAYDPFWKEIVYLDSNIVVYETKQEYDFIAVILNRTKEEVFLTFSEDEDDISLSSGEWMGLLNDSEGRYILSKIKSGDFTCRRQEMWTKTVQLKAAEARDGKIELALIVNYMTKRISLEVKHITECKTDTYCYSADEFSAALSKYNQFTKISV